MKIELPIIGEINIGKSKATKATPADIVTIDERSNEEKILDILGGSVQYGGRLSNEKTISHKLLEANREWVYRNNDVIALEVSKVDFELYSIGLKNGAITYDLIEDHPLLDLLDKFNPRTTKSDGIYMTQSHKKLTGDAFWLLDKNGSTVQNIFVLPPDKIELDIADPTDSTADLIKEYIYVDTIDGKQVTRHYAPDQIIHFKKPNPRNPFRGYGTVEAIADTIDSDILSNSTQKKFFERGAISNFVLTSEGKITQDQLKRIRAEMRAMYSGPENAFTTMIFGNGLKPADIGFSNRDMQFLDILEWYRDKIMIGFGNTKASIGIIDDVNRASFDGSYSGWLRSTVKPDMDSIIGTINEFLVPLFGDHLVLGYKDPVPEDVTDDVAEAVQLKAAGIMTLNEARERVGLDAIEGGDEMNTPATQNPQDNKNPKDNKDPNAKQPAKNISRIYRRKQVDESIPAGLRHIDLKSILRSRGIYYEQKMNKEFKEAAIPVIRQMLTNKKSKKTDVKVETTSSGFTLEQLVAYYEKQIKVVDILEEQFNTAVLRILDTVKEQALNSVHGNKSIKALNRFIVNKDLFDEEALQTKAQLDLTPILMQAVASAGQIALDMAGIDDTYIPFKIHDAIRAMVDKFAQSMLSTDKDKLTSIIADGTESGQTITEISDKINLEFGEYSKMQATRITRTEVLRASNMAAEDAFIQSGVVEGKQWLVSPSNVCDLCSPYSGKTIKLKTNFYTPDDSGFQDGNPPLHVNCRCVLIPVIKGVKAYAPDLSETVSELSKKISELEAQYDKRTRAYKDLQKLRREEKADDAAYIKALEKNLGIADE